MFRMCVSLEVSLWDHFPALTFLGIFFFGGGGYGSFNSCIAIPTHWAFFFF